MLQVRSGVREDTPAIVTLLNQSFRTPMDAATWEWYVYGNPLGSSQVYVAQEPGDEGLAGVIAFAPILLRIGGTTFLSDYAHHLALDPKYRDTMSYLAILRHSLNAQSQRGIKLAIGPPNKTAYPIHKMLTKWTDFGFLDCMQKLRPQKQAHACTLVDSFSGAFDNFYQRVSNGLSFSVEKNAEWMNWRFSRRPGAPYTIFSIGDDDLSGYIILKRWQDPDGYRKAHIIDLHAINDGALSQLLAAAESYAADCDELNLWAAKGYPYRSALEAMGFTAGFRQPLIVRTYDGSKIAYPEGNCSLAYGDGDTLY